jgi:hypothetical protein
MQYSIMFPKYWHDAVLNELIDLGGSSANKLHRIEKTVKTAMNLLEERIVFNAN